MFTGLSPAAGGSVSADSPMKPGRCAALSISMELTRPLCRSSYCGLYHIFCLLSFRNLRFLIIQTQIPGNRFYVSEKFFIFFLLSYQTRILAYRFYILKTFFIFFLLSYQTQNPAHRFYISEKFFYFFLLSYQTQNPASRFYKLSNFFNSGTRASW